MNRLLLIAGTLAFLGACSSGGGCDGGDEKKAPSGQSTGLPGGASSHSGTNETVSFQGLGKKAAGDPATGAKTAAADAPQGVICGGFPYLAADCKTDPVYDQIVKKCCPSGQVDQCQAIPGGARLIGRGCTVSTFTSVPAAAK